MALLIAKDIVEVCTVILLIIVLGTIVDSTTKAILSCISAVLSNIIILIVSKVLYNIITIIK